MSYVPMAPPPLVRARPVAVTAASILLYVVGALFVLRGFVDLAAVPTSVPGAQVVEVLALAVLAAIGAGLAVLGAFVGRGRNGARITTWVLTGLFTACCGFDTLALVSGSPETRNYTQGTETTEYETPGWARASDGTLSVLIVSALVAVIILLAIPVSNAYFRPVTAWPPYPVPGYPTPGYPMPVYPAPGYPVQGYPTPSYPSPMYPAPAPWTPPVLTSPVEPPAAPHPAVPEPPAESEQPR
jgi:hypothetical protein